MPERRRWRRDAVPARDIVGRKMRALSPPPAIAALTALRRDWPGAVGPLGEGSVPIGLSRNGALTVACRSAAQAQRLSESSDEILESLDAEQVQILRFVVSAAPADDSTDTASQDDRAAVDAPRPRHRVAARQAASAISDPVLRRLVERAAATSFARADSPANREKGGSSREGG